MTIKEVSAKYYITQDTLRYYERIKMIPPVTRTAGGIRNYQESDLEWVRLAICMRSAGFPVEVIIAYAGLCEQRDCTIPERLQLLREQHLALQEQKRQIDLTLKRLHSKIRKYEMAIQTGSLTCKEIEKQ